MTSKRGYSFFELKDILFSLILYILSLMFSISMFSLILNIYNLVFKTMFLLIIYNLFTGRKDIGWYGIVRD